LLVKKSYLTKIQFQKAKTYLRTRTIDLHGYTIDQANKTIENFITKSFEEKINKLIVVTGKGLHSQNEKNPLCFKKFKYFEILRFLNL
jgi:DNA-nicking Smr family endonuclease